jgi:rod shape-determining protein MreD
VCVVFLAFHEFSIVGVVLAFVLGLMLDMSSGIALGPWAGSYTLVYAVFAFLSQRLFVESKLVAMVVVITATLLAGGVFLALAYEYQKLSQDDLLTLGGQGVTSALITPAVFGVLSRIWRRSRLHGLHGNTVISAV